MCMIVRSFIDTNILVYTDDHDAAEKRMRALDIIKEARRSQHGVVSTQVLQEYFVSTTRKLGVAVSVARRKVELFARLQVVTIQISTILAAIDLQRLHNFSFWDALVVHSAKAAGCSILLTEDMQHGQDVEGLKIINPFLN